MIGRLIKKIKSLYYRRFGENRKSPRVPISVKVTNATSGNFSYYHAANLSQGGMFLKSEQPLPVGSTLNLNFSLPGSRDQLELEAEVVRIMISNPDSPYPAGMGVKFKDPPEAARSAISSFINART